MMQTTKLISNVKICEFVSSLNKKLVMYVKGTKAKGSRQKSTPTPSQLVLNTTESKRISMQGINTFIISAIMLLIQYAFKLMPEISYMCFRLCILSFKMKLIIAHGIRDIPTPTIKLNSNAFPASLLISRAYNVG